MKANKKSFLILISSVLLFGYLSSAAFAAKKKPAPAEDKNQLEEEAKKSKKKASKKVNENPFRAKTIEKTVDNVKYLVKGTVGSMQMYALGANGSQTSLLAGYDEFTSSFLSLLVDKKEYKLTNNIGIIIGCRPMERGVEMVYVVPNVARVLFSLETLSTEKKLINSDVIKVTVTVTNKEKKTNKFGIKAVYDTVLGEQFGPHFISNEEIAINSERQFRRFDKVKWVKSSNSKAGLEFLFSGAEASKPEAVSLSNKDLLALQKWMPQVMSSRTFDSVLSYNNSAVCINYEPKTLAPEEEYKVVYYLAVASDGIPLDGEKYIEEIEKQKRKEAGKLSAEVDIAYIKASELYVSGKYTDAYDVVQKEWKNPDKRTDRLESLKAMIEEKLGLDDTNALNDKKSPETEIKNLPETELPADEKVALPVNVDAAYIQDLINKIEALQEDSDDVDRDELIRLNTELDAVMKQLESK